MKVQLLRLGSANKPSPISEGVVEIQINSQPDKGINLITWHTQARRAPRVTTIHDTVKESSRVLPHPSAVFHAYASEDTPLMAQTLSYYTPVKWGKVSSNSSTHEATKFGDFICSVYVITFKCLFIQIQPTWALIDTGGGYHLRALNFRSDHSSSFPSNILLFPLIAPPGLILNYFIN
jgi:hypothetical protein